MSESREFPVAVIVSITTGILLCNFGEMHEAAEYLMGHPIWTHHFASKDLSKKMRAKVLMQYPSMPIKLLGVTKENYLEKVAEIEAILGKTVSITKGDEPPISPIDGLDELSEKSIVVMS